MYWNGTRRFKRPWSHFPEVNNVNRGKKREGLFALSGTASAFLYFPPLFLSLRRARTTERTLESSFVSEALRAAPETVSACADNEWGHAKQQHTRPVIVGVAIINLAHVYVRSMRASTTTPSLQYLRIGVFCSWTKNETWRRTISRSR